MKLSVGDLFGNQGKITKIRLKIQDLERKKKGHLSKIEEINRQINDLNLQIRTLNR